MKKFYVIGVIILVIIVGIFKVIDGKEEEYGNQYESIYLEENSTLTNDTVEMKVEKIKIHIIGEIVSPRNL